MSKTKDFDNKRRKKYKKGSVYEKCRIDTLITGGGDILITKALILCNKFLSIKSWLLLTIQFSIVIQL